MATQPIRPNRNFIIGVVFVGIAPSFLSFKYHSTWVEPVATVLLVCVTAVYVVFTYEALKVAEDQFKLLKEQNDRQDQVLLFLDLEIDPPNLKVCVSNLGFSNVLIQSIVARTSDELTKTHIFDLHRIVESGKTEAIALPSYLYDGESCPDFEFTVHYVGIKGSDSTVPKSFNIFSPSAVGADDELPIIRYGLGANWMAICPKCNFGWPIDVSGLKSFAAATARMTKVRQDMTLSCPDHKSEYMMSTGTIRAAQARTSLLTRFRPPTCLTLETQVQYKRNPARCQFTTVLGVTKTRCGEVLQAATS